MLPRAKRLDRRAFAASASGKRAASKHVSITYTPAREPRAAAVVSKKVAKKAVDRHLLSRRMLDAVAPHLGGGRSYILYARAGSPALSYRVLKAEIDALIASLPQTRQAV